MGLDSYKIRSLLKDIRHSPTPGKSNNYININIKIKGLVEALVIIINIIIKKIIIIFIKPGYILVIKYFK